MLSTDAIYYSPRACSAAGADIGGPMQLTCYSDYALRVLLYLAVVEEGATISRVAREYGISKNHLVKVVHDLGRKGYVATFRGRSGGLRLARAPEEINLGQVLRDVEVHFNLVECFNRESNRCVITRECALKQVLWKAREAFLSALDGYVLADLLVNKELLADRFQACALRSLRGEEVAETVEETVEETTAAPGDPDAEAADTGDDAAAPVAEDDAEAPTTPRRLLAAR